ncbi:MAG: phosphatase PAP2 family protein [Deltaproteobacteria bacterium]|nr:phosphatase PAP2 family protein [Deltaproteobacteria bacterium]
MIPNTAPHRFLLLTIFIFVSALQAKAGETTRKEVEAPRWHDMITNIPGDYAAWWKDTWQPSTLPAFTLVTVSTAGLVITDYQTWKPFSRRYEKGGTYKSISDTFAVGGEGIFQFGLAGTLAVYGGIAGDKRALRTASQIVESILITSGVVQFLKHATGRESPSAASTPTGRWVAFPSIKRYYSRVSQYDAFPSGHLATTLTTIHVAAFNYPEAASWIYGLGYPFATLVAFGLVATGGHWWSDYPLSIMFAHQFAKVVTRNNGSPVEKTSLLSPRMQPMMTGAPGVLLSWDF